MTGALSRSWPVAIRGCLAVLLLTAWAPARIVQGQTARPVSTSSQIPGGPFEASGVIAVPGTTGVLFVDDGRTRDVLWFDLANRSAPVVSVPLGVTVPDMEDITTDGTFFYVVGSQSKGGRKANGLVRFRFDARTRQATDVQAVPALRDLITAAVPSLRTTSRGRAPLFDIEGLTWDEAHGRLLLGLRSPQLGDDAVVIALRPPDGALPLSAASLVIEQTPIRLSLGGLAVRGLGYDADTRKVLVIGGASTDDPRVAFRLFEWDGVAGAAPRELRNFGSADKPEGVTRITIDGRARTFVVSDLGAYRVID